MSETIAIFEATVNNVPEWRVYINQELKYKFPSKEQAEYYIKLHNRNKKDNDTERHSNTDESPS